MIAGPNLRQQARGDGGHPAGRGARRLGAFQQAHALLEHRDGRIGEARIDEAGIIALEPRLGRLHRRIGEALRQKQRLGQFAKL